MAIILMHVWNKKRTNKNKQMTAIYSFLCLLLNICSCIWPVLIRALVALHTFFVSVFIPRWSVDVSSFHFSQFEHFYRAVQRDISGIFSAMKSKDVVWIKIQFAYNDEYYFFSKYRSSFILSNLNVIYSRKAKRLCNAKNGAETKTWS